MRGAWIWVATVAATLMAACGSLPLEPEDDAGTGPTRFHAPGWALPEKHGTGAKQQDLDCRGCHGPDLLGGQGPSCDTCHAAGWRTNCTYCHGGTDNPSGAPPRDLSGETQASATRFPGHTAHGTEAQHAAFDCAQCHKKPTDVLSAGHMFDDTPGRAEVDLSQGTSPGGTYDGGTCSTTYCHGNGRGPTGEIRVDAAPRTCASCHPSAQSSAAAWATMSGQHALHLSAGFTCSECHTGIVSAGGEAIADPAHHVNGRPDVAFGTSSILYASGNCTGACHGDQHLARSWWNGEPSPHPTGWAASAQHGLAAKQQQQDCRTCHGADLTGGLARGCDSCHAAGWRTNCTYCHGGTDDTSGAPPRDLSGATAAAQLTFPGHGAHVSARTTHLAWDCTQCHQKPTDVLSAGHVFDSTPGKAEVVMSGGLSQAGTYESGTCASVYCHGNGQGPNGTVTTGAGAMTCRSCHSDGRDAAGLATMSGQHGAHVRAGLPCSECHTGVVNGSGDGIVDATRHVNGRVDVGFGSSDIAFTSGTCTGTCHASQHAARPWLGHWTPHPTGWSAAAQHGAASNAQQSDCRTCHGSDLAGGVSAKSCDSCHQAGWRTNCVYCHGGTDNQTGAPPRDVSGTTQAALLSFPAHSQHVSASVRHAAFDCGQCHNKPTDVLSPGHLFDQTPGKAEVTFAAGLGAGLLPAGTYASKTCTDSYCHGNGQGANGVVATTAPAMNCASCHSDGKNASALATMSGRHRAHVAAGIGCSDCHGGVVNTTGDGILDAARHVNGRVDLGFGSTGVTFAAGTCNGTCHSSNHLARPWTGPWTPHPTGFGLRAQHGPASNLQQQDCRTCHGADLTGGSSGKSCDSCHLPNWRTNCTYCHGGTADQTGAPPRDLSGATSPALLSFPGHAVHVNARPSHAAWDCTQCHQKPTDVLSPGHLFDATPGKAEIDLSQGLSRTGTYTNGTCNTVYCHGNGQRGATGTVSAKAASMTCASCHSDGKNAAAAAALSGYHRAHVLAGIACSECHAGVVNTTGDGILDPARHVNGQVDLSFPGTNVAYAGGNCSGTCHASTHTARPWVGAWTPHPTGFGAAGQHGVASKLQQLDCRTCHGADLTGGVSGKSCDSCHQAGWRTNCTYCHGGTDNPSGAPPRDLSGATLAAVLSFPAHTAHGSARPTHSAFDCVQCHYKPTDVLTAGHLFDATPGVAEVTMAGGLSTASTYASKTCSNNYCHGNGQAANGTVASNAAPMTCTSCHPGISSSTAALNTMSGRHRGHLAVGATCSDCHTGVVNTTGDGVLDPARHVNGRPDSVFGTSNVVYAAGSCNGTCHSAQHAARPWVGPWTPHPAGWATPTQHGVASNLQQQDCRTCHGADLTGGVSGTSCDSCHQTGWRTNCTYCHGGTADSTGAPPQDLNGTTAAALTSFPGHTAHVNPRASHVAWDCTQCHNKPTDVLSAGHAFDATPGTAEVELTRGLSTLGTYASKTCSTTYCHGNGQGANGTVTTSAAPMTCASCHSDGKNAAALATMSGRHRAHVVAGVACAECHAGLVNPTGDAILDATRHVNGQVDLSFAGVAVAYTGGSCTGSCHGSSHTARPWVGAWTPHPTGFGAASQHGVASKQQQLDCRTCHGADLTGGVSGKSCDSCHQAGWRTNCTYCHGGTDNPSGAPPRDLSGATLAAVLSFPAHTAHGSARPTHSAFDCVQCHYKPTDVLTAGHLFDATPGVAEVTMAGGLSTASTYASKTCSNNYCHGNGQAANGTVASNAAPMSCTSCHPGISSSTAALNTMSGRHRGHLAVGATCSDCHTGVVNTTGDGVLDPARHVNGRPDSVFGTSNVVYAAGSCNGTCHSAQHAARPWVGPWTPHPAGWATPTQHGVASNLQQQDCRTCHGADLTGGVSGTSCDSCHQAGWRTNCTYCHGGTDNATGAPPHDLNGTTTGALTSFPGHTAHVSARTLHAAWDCTQCHVKPTDVLSTGHAFDATPAKSEVVFTGGLSPVGTYANKTCGTSYCHGNGRASNGTVTTAAAPMTCASCHPGPASTLTQFGTMSGQHRVHMEQGVRCNECHGATVNAAGAIIDPTKHVNGLRELLFAVTPFAYASGRCNGTCHNQTHTNETW